MIADMLFHESAFIKPSSVKAPNAFLGHIPFLSWLMYTMGPNRYVELGTHTGNSYLGACQAVVENNLPTLCNAIDTWQGDEHAGEYGDEIYLELSNYHDDRYHAFSSLMRMTFDEGLDYFSDGSIDLLLIDGLHTYDAVKHDFDTWLPKLSDRGVILFHDIAVKERGFGVWKLWEELSQEYPSIEFHHSYGLGVLFVGKEIPQELVSLIDYWNNGNDVYIRRFFEGLGRNLTQELAINELDESVNSLSSSVAELSQVRISLEHEVSSKDQMLARTQRVITDKDKEISYWSETVFSLWESTSWKVTAPLRLLMSLLKASIASANNLVIPFKNYGLKRSLGKVREIINNEGAWGLLKRLKAPNSFGAVSYQNWIAHFDTITAESRRKMMEEVNSFERQPLISVLMPVYNPPVALLQTAIDSITNQVYQNWEFCIADDLSTDPLVRECLERAAKLDPRIKVVFREENGHISAASNSALELVTGEFVALLDHDDELPEDALFWVAKEIIENPEVKLIYSDEDKIDIDGNRLDPYFKSEWNRDLFMSHNMISHLGVYETARFKDIGGFRIGLEGSQDYDLALRFIEGIDPSQIRHIPRILYHWRIIEGSTALQADEKPYAMVAGEKALNDYFSRNEIKASAELLGYGYRVRYNLPEVLPLVSVIIPTYNGLELLRVCVDSILAETTYTNYELVIVDNNSDDSRVLEYLATLQEDSRVSVLRYPHPFNYSAINNFAVSKVNGDIVALLNNDIKVISPDWMSEMVSHALRDDVGAVGARLLYPDGTIQHGGIILGLGGMAAHSHKGTPSESAGYFGRAQLIQSLSAVTAACLFVRKDVYQEVGGLDEDNLAVAYNDVDFCLRLKEKGYTNVWTPYAELFHYESKTRGEDLGDSSNMKRLRSEARYMRERWGEIIAADPAYSPNLTLLSENFGLAFPPRVEHTL